LYKEGGEAQALPVSNQDGYTDEIQYFVDCASMGLQPVRCPARESAAAVKLTKLMVEARNRKGEKLACRL
jgi:hypothetical protein